MQLPFEASFEDVQANLDSYVDAVFEGLQSEFLTLPKGPGFIEYEWFEHGYQRLKQVSRDFKSLKPDVVLKLVYTEPIVFVVLRTMLGFTPPEWAYVTTERTRVAVSPYFSPGGLKKAALRGISCLSRTNLCPWRRRPDADTVYPKIIFVPLPGEA